jgi:hypothetical protein
MYLVNLTGVKKKEVPCEFFKKSKEIDKIFKKGLAATATDYNGAINVWIDDNDKYRCNLHVNFVCLEELEFDSFKSMLEKIDEWLIKIK